MSQTIDQTGIQGHMTKMAAIFENLQNQKAYDFETQALEPYKKVQVGKGQEKAQSEKDTHSKN